MSEDRGFPLSPRICSWKSLPTSQGKARMKLLWSSISRKLTNSPISAGRLRSLLHDTSSWMRPVRRPISGGRRTRLLSFKYSEVRCWNCQSVGLRLRMVPESESRLLIMEQPSTSFFCRQWFDGLCYREGRHQGWQLVGIGRLSEGRTG